MRFLTVLSTAALFLSPIGFGACRPSTAPAEADGEDTAGSVWSVDLVRTLPGAQADYIRSIETNWARARRIAQEQGGVLSYRALVAAPDSTRGWDVMLMTEYADSVAWANREATFAAIFASPEFQRVEPARPSAEMRAFAASGVTLRTVVSEPPR